MNYFRVSPRIWTESWSEDARLLAFYVLTCPHRSTEGLFRLPKAYTLADLGWTEARFSPAFEELTEAGFIEYDEAAQILLIVKALKYQAPANPNGLTAAMRIVEQLPPTPLLLRFQQLAEQFSERLAEGLSERFAQSPSPSPSPKTGPASGARLSESESESESVTDLETALRADGFDDYIVEASLEAYRSNLAAGKDILNPLAYVRGIAKQGSKS